MLVSAAHWTHEPSFHKHLRHRTTGSILCAGVAALLLSTALSAPSSARGRGISLSLGGVSGGVGGAAGGIGGIGGTAGGIASGNLGSVGISIGRGGLGGSSGGFT